MKQVSVMSAQPIYPIPTFSTSAYDKAVWASGLALQIHSKSLLVCFLVFGCVNLCLPFELIYHSYIWKITMLLVGKSTINYPQWWNSRVLDNHKSTINGEIPEFGPSFPAIHQRKTATLRPRRQDSDSVSCRWPCSSCSWSMEPQAI